MFSAGLGHNKPWSNPKYTAIRRPRGSKKACRQDAPQNGFWVN